MREEEDIAVDDVTEEAEEEEDEEDIDDSNIEPENRICVIQRLLCSTKLPEPSQRQQIFQSYCLVKEKKCRLIIDSCSCENLVSKSLVNSLKLATTPHPNPYTVGWIRTGAKIKVTELCQVPIAIGRSYCDDISCDVLDMDACNILLGRPWQFDLDTSHSGRENAYRFTWQGRKVRLLPLSPSTTWENTTHRNNKTLMRCKRQDFLSTAKESRDIFALLIKENLVSEESPPEAMLPLLDEF